MNTLLPIVTRELRVRARQPRTFYTRVGGATLVILIVIGMLMFVSGFSGAGKAGGGIFGFLVWSAFLYCLTEGVRSTADCLSEEKRAGTLGLLFLTDLRGYDVVLGKLIGAGLNSFYVLLAILPPIAVPILLGGVTGGEFWRSALALLVTLIFSLSVGLMVSALARDERRAWSATVVILLGMAIVPPIFDIAPRLVSGKPFGAGVFSPTTIMLSLWDQTYTVNPAQFWRACGIVFALAMLQIGVASWALPNSWQEEPLVTPKREPPRSADSIAPDLAPQPVRRGRHLLAVNPIFWLANRTTGDASFLWLVAGTGMLVTVMGIYFAHDSFNGTVIAAMTLLGLHYLMVARIAWEACHQLAGARDSGALEILLCTPLTPDAIIKGHLNALNRLYLRPSLAMLALALILFAVHFSTSKSAQQAATGTGVLTLVTIVVWGIAFMDLQAAAVYGLWQGLRMRKPSQAVSRTLLVIVGLPLVSMCCWILWPVVALVKNLVAMNYARDQLQRNFRNTVAARYEVPGEGFGSGLRKFILTPTTEATDALPQVLPRKPE